MSITPTVSRLAKLMKDTTEVGYTEEYTWSAESDIIKKYQSNSQDPALLEYGTNTYTITLNRIVVDPDPFWNALANGTKLTLEIRPQGTGSGKTKFTFSNCVVKSVSGSAPLNDSVIEKVTVEAKGLTIGTQT